MQSHDFSKIKYINYFLYFKKLILKVLEYLLSESANNIYK